MSRKLLAAVLALSITGFAYAATETAGKAHAKRPAQREATPAPAASAADKEAELVGRTVFEVLVGEIALQRGNIEMALGAYADLAQRTHDPRVIERAVDIAGAARQYELAFELSQQWSQIEPQSQKARQALATFMVALNRLDDLAPQLAILLEEDKPNLRDNLMRLNRMLARHPDRQAVVRIVEQVTLPYLDLPEAHFARATAAAAANDLPHAMAELDKAQAQKPDWEMAALLRAQLQARKSPNEAIDSLARFVDRYPASTDARLALARLLITEKRYEESRRHFDRLLRDHPDNPEVIYPVAMLALQQNDVSTGKAQLEKLLGTDFGDKSTVHFFLGQIEEEQKHPDAAIAHYREVTAGEQYIPARARMAVLTYQQGKLDDARKLLQTTAARSDGEKAQLALAEAQLLREAKRYDEAYKRLADTLAKQPENLEILYEAALMAERNNRLDLLETHLKRLLAIKPDHAHALNALGYSWADRNIKLGEAHDLISRALALLPDDPFIMDSLGWVLYRQGKFDEALKTLSDAYGRKPDPEIAAHLGEVLWSLNRKDDARKLLSEAAKKDPDNDVLTAAVKKFTP